MNVLYSHPLLELINICIFHEYFCIHLSPTLPSSVTFQVIINSLFIDSSKKVLVKPVMKAAPKCRDANLAKDVKLTLKHQKKLSRRSIFSRTSLFENHSFVTRTIGF